MTRVWLHTFGCKANQYDTEVVRQALEEAGATIVRDPAQADHAVVNSCTVTQAGEAKLRGLVRRLARTHGTRSVVMGCAAAVDDGRLRGVRGVAAVVGGADPGPVLEALGLPPVSAAPLRRFDRGSRAWLRIQDGCDEHCTFCATTRARGANRSRPAAGLVAEARTLAETAEEIVLTGIHIGTWGRDLEPGQTLGGLCARLVAEVPQVRFRLSSVEATEVGAGIERLMVEQPDRLAPHLHAPLQSGSDRVLKRMGRHWYTRATYARRIEALAARLPVFGLGADVMVGFPGETDADFAATEAAIADLPFTYLHVFPYSERPGTAAPRLGRPVTPAVAGDRAARLRAIARARGEAHRRRRVGTTADVVPLDRAGGRRSALTGDYLTVYLPADGPARRARVRLGADGPDLVAKRSA